MSGRSSKHQNVETRGGLPSLSSLSTSLTGPSEHGLLETLSSESPFDPMSWRALLALCATEKTTLHQWCNAVLLYEIMQTGGFTICPEAWSWREKMNTLSPFVGEHEGQKRVVEDRALVAIALSHCLRAKEEGLFAVGEDEVQTEYNKRATEERHTYFLKCKGLWKESLRIDGLALEGADDPICKDEELVMEAIKQNGGALSFADDVLRGDRNFLLRALTTNGLAFKCLPDANKDEYEFQLAAAYGMHHQLIHEWQDKPNITPLIEDSLIKKLERGMRRCFKEKGQSLVEKFVKTCIQVTVSPDAMEPFQTGVGHIAAGVTVNTPEKWHVFASYCLLYCKPMVVALASQTALPLNLFTTMKGHSMDLATDADIAMAQVKLNGRLLQRFNTKFSNNKPIVIEAVRDDSAALEWASADLKDDEYVVSTAAVRGFRVIQGWASERLKNDPDFVDNCSEYALMWRDTWGDWGF